MDNLELLAATEDKQPRKRQIDEILEVIFESGIELFNARTEAFASYRAQPSSHRETYPIGSRAFQRLITRIVYERLEKAMGGQATKDALDVLEAKALHAAPTHPVALRVGEQFGRVYVDLGGPEWEIIEISAGGWAVADNPPIRFYRSRATGELPAPERGGSLLELRAFVNCADRDFPLLVAWLLAGYRCTFPTPVLSLHGEQGSAKSTTAQVLQSLLDPGIPPMRSAPRTEQDLIVGAMNRRLLAFDNLSGIPDWLSDALCRLVTDGGFATRQLYSDSEEVIFEGRRAILLNGIDDLARRSDLADRSIVLTLPSITERQRRGGDLLEAFQAARGRLLGAIFDALVVGLNRWPLVQPESQPRMADFARWGSACQPAFGLSEGSFAALYGGNRREAAEQTLESDLVATAVRDLMEGRDDWEGTSTALLEKLTVLLPESAKTSRSWPKVPNALSGRLKRAAPALRSQGIYLDSGKTNSDGRRRRSIRIWKTPNGTVPIVRPVPGTGSLPLAARDSEIRTPDERTMREPGEDDDDPPGEAGRDFDGDAPDGGDDE